MVVQGLSYIDLRLLRLAVQQDLSREKVIDSDAKILHLYGPCCLFERV